MAITTLLYHQAGLPPPRPSCPYFTIAKRWCVDYGEVLRFVDMYEHWMSLGPDMKFISKVNLTSTIQNEIKAAVRVEHMWREIEQGA